MGRPEGRHTYYVCNGHQSRVYTGRFQSWSVRSSRTDRLDPLVWDDVCRLLTTPQLITDALRKAHVGELLHDEANDRLRHLEQARQKVERQVERLVDAFTAEVLTLEELKTRRVGLQERIRILTQQERALRQSSTSRCVSRSYPLISKISVRLSAQGCRRWTLPVADGSSSC